MRDSKLSQKTANGIFPFEMNSNGKGSFFKRLSTGKRLLDRFRTLFRQTGRFERANEPF